MRRVNSETHEKMAHIRATGIKSLAQRLRHFSPGLPILESNLCLWLLDPIQPPVAEKFPIFCIQRASVWSMKKDPALEKALKRNQRWTVNNQLKNIILRCPGQVVSVKSLQKKAKNLDFQGNVLNWIKKYPCFFEIYTQDMEIWCKFTKKMNLLIEEEEAVKEQQEPALAERLAKILMLTCRRRLNILKFNDLRKSFGLPDDYVLSIVLKYPEQFRVNDYNGKRNNLEIELLSWNPSLAVSVIDRKAGERAKLTGEKPVPVFENWLPESWKTSVERFNKFQEVPYISPYFQGEDLEEGSEQLEKRVVGVIHELLSLTLWKRMSIAKLVKFQREFRFPDNLAFLLLRHPAIFYVSNKNDIHTVVLRDGYVESGLVEKDPLVVVKEKFGELMQDGLYEYTERRRIANLENRKANRPLWKMNSDVKRSREIVERSDSVEGKENRSKEEARKKLQKESKENRYQEEARKRFQKATSSPGISSW